MTLAQLQQHRALVAGALWGWLTVCTLTGAVIAAAALEYVTRTIRALRRAA